MTDTEKAALGRAVGTRWDNQRAKLHGGESPKMSVVRAFTSHPKSSCGC